MPRVTGQTKTATRPSRIAAKAKYRESRIQPPFALI